MTDQTALVTGISGFAGSHLARHLLQEGLRVFGLRGTGAGEKERGRERERERAEGCETFEVDLRDAAGMSRIVGALRPDYVFHLAARTSDAESFRTPTETLSVNILGTLNLLEALRGLEHRCRVVLVGSSAVYGRVPEDRQPIDESTPYRPLSPYGTSKAAQDLLGRQYADTYGLEIVRAIAFNHTGPGQRPDAALPAFARQIADAESGRTPPTIHVGDLSARRDVLDVRDVVRAYWLLAQRGEAGEAYNVCSGQAPTMQSLLDALLKLSRGPALEVRGDPARMRPAVIPLQVGSNARLRAATGWQPVYAIDETLRVLLDYWRQPS